MEPRDYLATIRRNWIIVLVMTMLGLAGGYAASAVAKPEYTATTSLYFSINFGKSANDLNQGATYAQSQMLSYAVLARSPRVLQTVIDELALPLSPAALASKVSATSPQNTPILDIGASDASPAVAAEIANSVAAVLGAEVQNVAPRNEDGDSTLSSQVIKPAVEPRDPSAPNVRANLAVGLLLGLLLGGLLAVLRDAVDNRVRRASQVNALTEAPVLGQIERDSGSAEGGLVVQRDPISPSAESFRALRTNLQFVAVDSESLTVVITSSLPGEGKSTIASNLALAIAEAEQSVLLIDADLRRAAIAGYNGIEGAVGLTTILIGRAAFEDVVQVGAHPALHILASGELPPNPSEMLASRAMHSLVEDLRARYDVIIIDAAPLLAVSDAASLSQIADGVIMVVDSTAVRKPQLTRSLDDLTKAGAALLGVVLNKVPRRRDRVPYGPTTPAPTRGSSRARSAGGPARRGGAVVEPERRRRDTGAAVRRDSRNDAS